VNIALFTPAYPPLIGGVELVVANLAKFLSRAGHSVVVLTNPADGRTPENVVVEGLQVHRFRMDFDFDTLRAVLGSLRILPRALFSLRHILSEASPDVLNLHYVSRGHALCALVAARLTGIPLVASVHGTDVAQMPYVSRTCRIVSKRVLQSAVSVTANSEHQARLANKLVEPQQLQTQIIRNGVDLGEFSDCPRSERDGRYILAAGRFDTNKGFDILIEAFSIVCQELPDARLVIAGNGPELVPCQRLASELNVASRIEFTGWADRAKIIQLFRGCSFFVLPSRNEALGMVNLEAMAAAKAIVATAVGGVPEVVEDGVTALLAEPDSPQALAERMMRLWQHPELCRQLGRSGRTVVEAEYSWHRTMARFERVYEQTIQGSR